MQPRRIEVCLFLLATLNLVGNAGPTTDSKPYATPKEVFEAARVALNGKAFYHSLTPDSQKLLNGYILIGGVFFEAFAVTDDSKKAAKAMEKVFSKHGVTGKAVSKFLSSTEKDAGKLFRAAAELIKNPDYFFDDYAAAMKKAYGKTYQMSFLAQAISDDTHAELSLTDLKVNGDKASGRVIYEIDGKKTKTTIHFVKAGSSWKIALFERKFDPPAREVPDKAKTD